MKIILTEDQYEQLTEIIKLDIKVGDTITGKIWKGDNLVNWVKENYDLIHNRTRNKNQTIKYMAKCLASVRCRNTKIWGFVVEY